MLSIPNLRDTCIYIYTRLQFTNTIPAAVLHKNKNQESRNLISLSFACCSCSCRWSGSSVSIISLKAESLRSNFAESGGRGIYIDNDIIYVRIN